jgi:hypothetical protein
VARPEAQLRDIGQRLGGLAAKYDRAHDRRAVAAFSLAYMMGRLADRVASEGHLFDDVDWVVRLGEALHGRFIDACTAYDADRQLAMQSLPRPYQALFEILVKGRPTVFEALVFPLTVHILHDLPFALVDVKFAESSSHLADFDRINGILSSEIGNVQALVHKRYDPKRLPLVLILDRLGGPLDKLVTDGGFRVSRAWAWYQASRLSDSSQRLAATDEVLADPVRVMKDVRNPPVSQKVHWLYRLARSVISRFPFSWPTHEASH